MGYVTSHCLKWGPFSAKEVGRIAQHVRKKEGSKEGKDREAIFPSPNPVRDLSINLVPYTPSSLSLAITDTKLTYSISLVL